MLLCLYRLLFFVVVIVAYFFFLPVYINHFFLPHQSGLHVLKFLLLMISVALFCV